MIKSFGQAPPRYAPRSAPPEAFLTYGIRRPLDTHWRRATCAEYECPVWRNGGQLVCDLRTEDGLRQARQVRDSAMRYTYERQQNDCVIVFTFPPGTSCTAPHLLPIAREPLYIVRNGDHRGAGRRRPERRTFDRGDQWTDDFATHQDRLAEAVKRG